MHEFELSPEELYFMGIIMNAEFIDYNYISAMKDIQKNYEYTRQKCIENLEKRGLVDEDFSGNINIDDKLSALLNAIFFGRLECKVNTSDKKINIHINKEKKTCVEESESLRIYKLDINDLIKNLPKDGFTIRCTHVEKGYYEETFTEADMNANHIIDRINKITSGECYSQVG